MATNRMRGLVPPNVIANKFKSSMWALNLETQALLRPKAALSRRSKSSANLQIGAAGTSRVNKHNENKPPIGIVNSTIAKKMPEIIRNQSTVLKSNLMNTRGTTVAPKRTAEPVTNGGPNPKSIKSSSSAKIGIVGVSTRKSNVKIRRVSRVQASQRQVPRVQATQRRVSRVLSSRNVLNRNIPTQKPTIHTAVPKKPAPYDYKTRFQLLLEKHNELKDKYTESENELTQERLQCQQTLSENNSLKSSNRLLRSELEQTSQKNESLSQLFNDLKANFQQISSENNILKNSNQQLTSQLEQISQEKERLNKLFIDMRTKFLIQEKEIEEMKIHIEKQAQTVNDLTDNVLKFDEDRRRMHNVIQDLKGNIRVFCRVRPPLPHERGDHMLTIDYKDETSLEVSNNAVDSTSRRVTKQEFSFNHVFNEDSTQEQVFLELGQLVQSVLDGYNVCVFAYGQTGSGKTFTMEGGNTPVNAGMIPRTVEHLFAVIEQRKALKWFYEVKVTFVQIYNEKIYDMLQTKQLPHEIRMMENREGDVYITNLDTRKIHDAIELKQLLIMAQKNRTVAATQMNDRSSRSHAITKIEVTGKNINTNEKFQSYLNLVDLAGSERVRNTEVTRLTETKNINKSLSNLSNVILGLKNKNDHIPYRDSKLTHMLMPSLGGNSKTLMFVNISPLTECFNETMNSLRFAAMVNSCKVNAARKNRVNS